MAPLWILLAVGLPGNQLHPLHTTFTEIVQAGDSVTVTVRGFADDLTLGASGGRSTTSLPDSALARYLGDRLQMVDRHGSRIRLTWRGVRKTADVLWFSYSGRLPSLVGSRVSNAALCEVHRDQVNIVQVQWRGGRQTLMFTPGDGTKQVGR